MAAAVPVRMTVRRPDGVTAPVALTADPAASDPTNPFEQSFSGTAATGAVPGMLTVTVRIETPGAPPRTVTRDVPVVGR